MSEPIAQRTLVKSPPELWAEISDVESLARHLGAFGEIRITRMVPETAVSWEGEIARGTVELSAAGWGTKVTLTATATTPAASQPPAVPVPPPAPAMLDTPHAEQTSDRRAEAPAAPAPLDRTPAAEPADEPRWAASVEQKVRDRYVGAPPTTHRSDAREHVRDEPRSGPATPATTEASNVAATPATTEASTVAATPAPVAVAPLPRTDADAGPPEKARPPRGLLARLKYWFTPPEDAGAKVTSTTVPEKATSAPEPTASVEITPPPVNEPAEPRDTAAIEPTTAGVHAGHIDAGLASPEPVSAEPRKPALATAEPATPAESHSETPSQPDPPVDEGTIVGILTSVLDELGSAHHRPFSRG